MTRSFVFVLTLYVILTDIPIGESVKKNVTILKCCAKDESLTYDQKCVKNFHAGWDLNIYKNSSLTRFKENLPLTWILKEKLRPNCHKPVIGDLSTKKVIPFINGKLLVVEHQKLIANDKFCLDYNLVIYCEEYLIPENISVTFVKKCCPEGSGYSEVENNCVNINDVTKYKIDVGKDKRLNYAFPTCQNGRKVAGKQVEGELKPNGSFWLPKSRVLLPAGNFCLEHIVADDEDSTSPSVIACSEDLPILQASTRVRNDDIRFVIYPIGLAISAIFLAATLAASLLPASRHHSMLHWRCQTNHVACLMVADALLCITQLIRNHVPYVPCFALGVSMHFLFLAAFFWLNTMCFNIWWTFKAFRPSTNEKNQEKLKLRLYEGYAWGVPFVIVFIGAVSDLSCRGGECDILRPRFGEKSCWFYGENEDLPYFYGPMGILLFVNLLLFLLTARELTCGMWKSELVKATTERAALGLVCLKLVVVMGVTWIADIISWAVGGPKEIWMATDIINCLQGVFIFIVVVCQKQVLQAVKRAWMVTVKHRGQNGNANTTNHHSSSSQGLPSVGDTLTNTNSVTMNTTQNNTNSLASNKGGNNGKPPLETSC